MASNRFTHSGTILSISEGKARIGFESQGACAGCQARAKCGMVDSSTREVYVNIDSNHTHNIGDEVEVAISYKMGMMSVVIAYIVPLFLLIGILTAAISAGLNEGIAALISLASVVIYFGVVYLFRSKLDKQIIFTIEK
ncbi:MAG: SoxR reducing system RseC family protein [Rikenellaceae bacterium]